MGEGFNYAKEFKSLDQASVKKDLAALMTDSHFSHCSEAALPSCHCEHSAAILPCVSVLPLNETNEINKIDEIDFSHDGIDWIDGTDGTDRIGPTPDA